MVNRDTSERREYDQLSNFEKRPVVGIRKAGCSNRRIGDQLNLSDMVIARSNSSFISRLTVPPKKLSILNEHEEEITQMAGPYLEGQNVRLTCEAIGGKPSPILSWWRGEKILLDATPTHSLSQGQVRSDYTFAPTRDDYFASIRCKATNHNGTGQPSTVAVQIDLYLKPLDIHLTPQPANLGAGRKAEIRCHSSGSRPPARMSWFLEGEPLSNHTDLLSVDGNRTTSVLSFWPSRADHRKNLRCRAENFLLSGSALEDGWELNITYVPLVSLSLRSSSSSKQQQQGAFLEGEDARFNCEVRANPPATQVGWLFEGRPLPEADPEAVLGFRTLLLRRVRRKHRGRYQCYANNSEGTGFSRIVDLRVLYAPVCRPGLKMTYAAGPGELSRIECQVDADPAQLEFRWSFSNAQRWRHYDVPHTSAGLRSVASYVPRAAHDYGALYCWGKNEVGEQQTPCIFTVIPVGPPEAPRNCSLADAGPTSVTILCSPGSDPDSTDLRYNLEVFVYRSHEMALQASSRRPRFVVEGLTPITEYLFVVRAIDRNGKSDPAVVRASTPSTPSEERVYREKEITSSSWMAPGLLIAASLACFLLFSSAALWAEFRGGPGCQKCKELPKRINLKKDLSKGIKSNKNYIDRLPEGFEKRTPCI
ncbi:LOW QUALITY PROTEIN: B-cell receptor CD22-like [Uloborus diversus]|uniref:LOW QUALITY PROTEIN: B-cell receptor CD22-like n=1 Tax=Uloborus diversus TaxID=327109 RepID=UPI0024095AA4|nr:LOW QUALITY PROTEIN: B-cell receptor CD22-like [Uloborus diversus]